MRGAALVLALVSAFTSAGAQVRAPLPPPLAVSAGWLMQDVAQVTEAGDVISTRPFRPAIYVPRAYVPPPTAPANPPSNPGANRDARPQHASAWTQAPAPASKAWYRATVPGTVLTTLVANNVYPDPLYGENNRPNVIPESLCRTSYWFRTEIDVPAAYMGRRVWLNFDGINYMADVWVNGQSVGHIRGAFARGVFDVTSFVTPGARAAIAVLIKPPLIPADPEEQTQQWGLGLNGGVMSKDGPTFISTQGWDWLPAMRDRDMGIWQKVTLSATGDVVIRDPRVVTDLPLPRVDAADVSIDVPLTNAGVSPMTGVVTGRLGDLEFRSPTVTLAAGESRTVSFAPATTPVLRMRNPKLWWPNGFGEPNLYPLRLSFESGAGVSDTTSFNVGVREVTYQNGASENLALVVNGVPVFAKGGDWGLDEAMKRAPRERLDVQMRLHKEANYTIVRNWVGQSTSEDFYDLADRYGLMVWDEFFQPYAGLDAGRQRGEDGETDISDVPLYLANAREKVLRFRNHPSIVLWCGRNEGDPSPRALASGLAGMMAELDPGRLYQKNSDAGRGVKSGGPYYWQPPQAYYGEGRGGRGALTPFKTEIGSISIPTIEAIYAMMPAGDAETFPNDDWAEHDFATGGGNNSAGDYIGQLTKRYGPVDTLPKFVRAAQMANYEAFRALYEGRLAKMFNPANAVITWMSNPAQPSFTWQIYSHDLEPFASFFGTKKACEPVHVMLNQVTRHVFVVNHLPVNGGDLIAEAAIREIPPDGHWGSEPITSWMKAINHQGTAPASAAHDLGEIPGVSASSRTQLIDLQLKDARGRVVSQGTYWRNGADEDNLTALDALPMVTLRTSVARREVGSRLLLDITLENPGTAVALMAHLQLRNQRTDGRVLPVFYSDNYISLFPGDKRTITIEAAAKDLGADRPLVVIDGWNVTAEAATTNGVAVGPNPKAMVR